MGIRFQTAGIFVVPANKQDTVVSPLSSKLAGLAEVKRGTTWDCLQKSSVFRSPLVLSHVDFSEWYGIKNNHGGATNHKTDPTKNNRWLIIANKHLINHCWGAVTCCGLVETFFYASICFVSIMGPVGHDFLGKKGKRSTCGSLLFGKSRWPRGSASLHPQENSEECAVFPLSFC